MNHIHPGTKKKLFQMSSSLLASLLRLGDTSRGSGSGGELARGKSERGVVNSVELEEEKQEEDGSSEDIEDTVPDHLRGRRDDVGTLGTCPADRVGEEEEGKKGGAEAVTAVESAVGSEGCAGSVPKKHIPKGDVQLDFRKYGAEMRDTYQT